MTAKFRNRWFAVPAPAPAAPLRLFCFPYAGAGASSFHAWAAALRALPLELCIAQLPGRENRLTEPPFVELSPIVDGLATAIAPLLDRPFCFFGHSMGTLVAFELARTLRARALPVPAHLFVSGGLPPHVPREHPPLHRLPNPEFAVEVAARYGGIPAAVLEHKELLGLILPALRADITLLENYQYGDDLPLACGITAFAGTSDPEVDDARLAQWGMLTTATFARQLFPGDHFYLQHARGDVITAMTPTLLALSP